MFLRNPIKKSLTSEDQSNFTSIGRHNQPLKLLGSSPSTSKPRNTSIKPIKNKAYHKVRQHKYLHLIGKIL